MERKFKKKLLEWKKREDRKPLLVKGVRQVGKTFLLKQFGEEEFPSMHYFNFEKSDWLVKVFEEDLDPSRILNQLMFQSGRSINMETDLVFFDEIQVSQRALTSLKYFQEEMPQLALCSAGSLLGLHLGTGSFPVGKVDMLSLFPMSFAEFLLAIGEVRSIEMLKEPMHLSTIVHDHLWKCLKWYFIVGGLPEVVKIFRDRRDNLYEAFVAVRQKQKELIKAYYADMTKHAGKVNAMHLDRVFTSVPSQLAQEQDSSKRYRFQGVVPNINRYSRLVGTIDWLTNVGLVHKVPVCHYAQFPLSAYTQENLFKLYLFDVGILGALSNLPPQVILDYSYGSYKGYFAENYVAQSFFCRGVEPLYCWHEKNAEVEFLEEIQGAIIPIEVKSGWVTKSKSLAVYASKYSPPFRVMFSAQPLEIKNSLHKYPLYLADSFPLDIQRKG